MIDSYRARDPAAGSRLEVALASTGLHAVLWHRLCHSLWRIGLHLFARMLANVGRWLFGIEIHPQARIGRRLFIDHGSGIVIGATAEIGDDVSIYQGVTLGGVTQVDRGKRHPTLEDGVIVGAGAKVLGPITVGAGARIGSNAVVVKEVEPGVTVVGVPGVPLECKSPRRQDAEHFDAYGVSEDEGMDQVSVLRRELDELRGELAQLKAASASTAESGRDAKEAGKGSDAGTKER